MSTTTGEPRCSYGYNRNDGTRVEWWSRLKSYTADSYDFEFVRIEYDLTWYRREGSLNDLKALALAEFEKQPAPVKPALEEYARMNYEALRARLREELKTATEFRAKQIRRKLKVPFDRFFANLQPFFIRDLEDDDRYTGWRRHLTIISPFLNSTDK